MNEDPTHECPDCQDTGRMGDFWTGESCTNARHALTDHTRREGRGGDEGER